MEAESNTEIQPENEQAGQRIRPFGIIDLIVVTTAMALQFKLYGLYMANSNINSVSMWMPLVFIYAMSPGLALSALYWLPMQFSCAGKFFRQPGYWILGCFSIVAVGGVARSICFLNFDPSLDPAINYVLYAILFLSIVANVCGAILLVVSAFRVQGRWRVAMIFLIAYFLVGSIRLAMLAFTYAGMFWFIEHLPWSETVEFVVGAIAAVALVVASCLDLVKRAPRDWLHWIGVVVAVVDLALVPLLEFASAYFAATQETL